MNEQFLFSPNSTLIHSHCASLECSPKNELFITWYAHPQAEDHKDGKILFSRKLPAQSWETSQIIFPEIQRSCANPLIYFDHKTQRLWLYFVILDGNYWNDALIYRSYSDDLGGSWTKPISCNLPKGIMIRHPALTLQSAEVIIPAYDERSMQSLILRHSESGVSISHRFDGFPVIQPVIVQESNTHLTSFFRPAAEPELVWRAHSDDQGKTWSKPVRTSLLTPLSGVAACYFRGHMIICHNPSKDRQRFPLAISTSEDRGVSWKTAMIVDNCKHEVSYPTLVKDTDDILHCAYTFNRRMIRYLSLALKDLI